MLKKLAILVLAIFCIIVELTVNTNSLSLSKRARTVFSSKIENVRAIEIKKLALMQAPKTIDTIEFIEETDNNEGKAVEEEPMEMNVETDEKEYNEEKISNTKMKNKTYEENNIIENEKNENQEEEEEMDTIDKNEENVIYDGNEEAEELKEETKPNLGNCIIIGGKVIKIKIAPGSQANVNAYDAVQDNEYFSDEDNIVILGHNYNSFRCLKGINIGEKIKLSNNGNVEEYIVFRSEKGRDNSDSTDIFSVRDGEELLHNLHGYDETLKLITCEQSGRWVISAYKI